MQQIRTDGKGNVVDANGNVIGKRIGDTVIPINQSSEPPTIDERLGVANQPPGPKTKPVQPSKQQYSTFNQQHTKYEVTKDSQFVIKFGLKEIQGRMIPLIGNYEEQRDVQQHWVKFRMWTYKEQLTWKDECMKFSTQSRNFMIDPNKLNEKKLRNLIKDWSFAEMSDRYKLLHTGGVLSDESYEVLNCLFPSIVNTIIYLMNEVLENNV